jgi:HEAT repeats
VPRTRVAEPHTYGTLLRGALDDVGNARTVTVSFDLEGHGDELIDALRQITQQVSPVSAYRLRIASHVVAGDAGTVLLDALASSSPATRRAAAEACGLLRAEVAVPALGVLLVDRVRRVRRAAAEALGRIGGHRAADQLIRGLRSRRLPVSWLLLALVRAAPDHFIEARLAGDPDARTLPWLVLAAGIRRRQETRPRLVDLLSSEDQRVRAWACRALGWIGDAGDVEVLRAPLYGDEDPQVREAAARALRRFREPVAMALLESLAPDRRPRPTEQPPAVHLPVASPSPPVSVRPVAEPQPVPEYLPVEQPVLQQPVPQLVVIQAAQESAPPPAAPRGKPPASRGLSPLSHLLARAALKVRARRRHSASAAPLTPLKVASTPHHYTPDPSLLDGTESFAEGA